MVQCTIDRSYRAIWMGSDKRVAYGINFDGVGKSQSQNSIVIHAAHQDDFAVSPFDVYLKQRQTDVASG